MAEMVSKEDSGLTPPRRKPLATKKKRKPTGEQQKEAQEQAGEQGSSKSIIKRLNIGKMYGKKKTKKKEDGDDQEDNSSSTTGTPEETASGKSESTQQDDEDTSQDTSQEVLETASEGPDPPGREALERSNAQREVEALRRSLEDLASKRFQDVEAARKSSEDSPVEETKGVEEQSPVLPEAPNKSTFQQEGGGGSQLKKEFLYKVLVIGELGTGKTSIIKRYVHQFFSQHYRATIGVDFALKVINWDQDTIIRLQLWDIAGQERFGNMTRVYYKEAVGAMIVFDVTRGATFDAVLKWKQDLDSKVQLADGSSIPCILLANKCDQPKEGIVNQPNKMEDFCRENNFTGWFETSAKENINIEKAAQALVGKILELDTSSENGGNGNHPGVYLHEIDKQNSSSPCSSC